MAPSIWLYEQCRDKTPGIIWFALAHCRTISGHHPHSGCMYLYRTVVDIYIVH